MHSVDLCLDSSSFQKFCLPALNGQKSKRTDTDDGKHNEGVAELPVESPWYRKV